MNDAEPIEVYASSVDSITFANFPVDPDDDPDDDPDRPSGPEGPIYPDDDDELEIPKVKAPGEGYTTIVLHIPNSGCDDAEPYILGELPGDGLWENQDSLRMTRCEGKTEWWQVTVRALTPENATNFKFRMEDGAGTWTYEPRGSYELLGNANDYLQVKYDELNNLVTISDCDNKVLYIKSGKWSTTPCKGQVPAGYAKFVLNVIGDIPEDAEVIFTGNFEENSWAESDRVMTKEADGIYSWEGEYPENFRFKAFISNSVELGITIDILSWLDGDDIYVESGAGSVIEFFGCFYGLCPEDEEDEYFTPETNGYEYVDLGLPSGNLWATMNVGADSPEDYGDYFAWGEIYSKDNYDWFTYKYSQGSSITLTKYVTETIDDWGYSFGYVDNVMELESNDDVAIQRWGGDWRIPTVYDLDELYNYCSWQYNEIIGGYLLTGPNGNSIYLPAAGYYSDDLISGQGEYGSYWTKSLDNTFAPDRAWALFFDTENANIENTYRNTGRTVRPVIGK